MTVKSGCRGLECHCYTIHAIAKTGWRRPIIEHVAEMSSTPAAVDFGASHHPKQPVFRCAYRLIKWLPEAWPPRVAIEFDLGGKQGQIASCARERSRPLFMIKRTAIGRLGPLLSEHGVLIPRQ